MKKISEKDQIPRRWESERERRETAELGCAAEGVVKKWGEWTHWADSDLAFVVLIKKMGNPPPSSSPLLIKTSPPLFPFLVLIKIFLWWHRHPFSSCVLRSDPQWGKTCAQLWPLFFRNNPPARWHQLLAVQAKKVSASDKSPIHLHRQCPWAQPVAQGGNANWKNSELPQGRPYLCCVLSLCLSSLGCGDHPLPHPCRLPLTFSHNMSFTS